MQSFIGSHRWLLGYQYEHLEPADFHREHGVDKWIEDVLLEEKDYSRDKRGRDVDLI